MEKQVKDLVPGDQVDLTGTVCRQFNYHNVMAEFEYGWVNEVVEETPDCFVVHFENLSAIALPPDFLVDVKPLPSKTKESEK